MALPRGAASRSRRLGAREALIRESLDAHPGDGASLYDLACVEALSGRHDAAIGHLREALAARPEVREWAAEDSELDALRKRPDFPL